MPGKRQADFDLMVFLGTLLLTFVDVLNTFMTILEAFDSEDPKSDSLQSEGWAWSLHSDLDIECGSPTDEDGFFVDGACPGAYEYPMSPLPAEEAIEVSATADDSDVESTSSESVPESGATPESESSTNLTDIVDLKELRDQHRRRLRERGLSFVPKPSDVINICKPKKSPTGKQLGRTPYAPEACGDDYWKWVLITEAKKALVPTPPSPPLSPTLTLAFSTNSGREQQSSSSEATAPLSTSDPLAQAQNAKSQTRAAFPHDSPRLSPMIRISTALRLSRKMSAQPRPRVLAATLSSPTQPVAVGLKTTPSRCMVSKSPVSTPLVAVQNCNVVVKPSSGISVSPGPCAAAIPPSLPSCAPTARAIPRLKMQMHFQRHVGSTLRVH